MHDYFIGEKHGICLISLPDPIPFGIWVITPIERMVAQLDPFDTFLVYLPIKDTGFGEITDFGLIS